MREIDWLHCKKRLIQIGQHCKAYAVTQGGDVGLQLMSVCCLPHCSVPSSGSTTAVSVWQRPPRASGSALSAPPPWRGGAAATSRKELKVTPPKKNLRHCHLALIVWTPVCKRKDFQDRAWGRDTECRLLGTEWGAGRIACRHLDQLFNFPFPSATLMPFLFNEQRFTHVTIWNMKKGEFSWRH